MPTSRAGAVAKYCDKYVCLRLCLCLSVCPQGYLRYIHARSLPNLLCTLPMSVARSSSGTYPIENALSASKGDGSAQRGRSILSTIALLLLNRIKSKNRPKWATRIEISLSSASNITMRRTSTALSWAVSWSYKAA